MLLSTDTYFRNISVEAKKLPVANTTAMIFLFLIVLLEFKYMTFHIFTFITKNLFGDQTDIELSPCAASGATTPNDFQKKAQ